MKLIYIAGPYRGKTHWNVEQNVRRAEEAALQVWSIGGVAICPHLNTRNFDGLLTDEIWLEGDLEILKRCDALLMIEGWQNSVGASKEKERAKQLELPVFRTLEDLSNWIHKPKYIKTYKYPSSYEIKKVFKCLGIADLKDYYESNFEPKESDQMKYLRELQYKYHVPSNAVLSVDNFMWVIPNGTRVYSRRK